MSPELTALARLLGELYHDSGTIVRLVEQAGMDATKLPLSNTTPANAWFAILELAESEGLLPQLIANVRRERPRNVALGAAWQAYVNERRPIADAVPSQALVAQRHREQGTLKMEEQNGRMGAIDARVDRLQRDVADLRATVAALDRGVFGDLSWVARRPLADGAQAFDDLHQGRLAAAKVVLEPG